MAPILGKCSVGVLLRAWLGSVSQCPRRPSSVALRLAAKPNCSCSVQRNEKQEILPPPAPKTPDPPALPELTQPARSASSLSMKCRYNRGLLGAVGLGDGGPHRSLLHVVVVIVMHVVARGR